MHLYDLTVPQLIKMLRNLDGWLAAAITHAEARQFEVDHLLAARLAPDQFAFAKQVQRACDNAKLVAARLAAKDARPDPDAEATFGGLRERITSAITFLEAFTPEDFAGAEDRKISLPWMDGKWMRGDEYVAQFALANFYFHVTTAYAILRHNGVDLGKRDFIGGVPMRS